MASCLLLASFNKKLYKGSRPNSFALSALVFLFFLNGAYISSRIVKEFVLKISSFNSSVSFS